MNILITGGAGFIGSHTCIELAKQGHNFVIVDNFINSSKNVKTRLEMILNKNVQLHYVNIEDKKELRKIFFKNNFDCVIHFAALKSVGESVYKPLKYYSNNVAGTLTLLEIMNEFDCKNLIFSSSATVYGNPEIIPITENCPKGEVTNPYGQTKSIIEQILMDMHNADILNHEQNPWNIVLLRYFNPIGAHPSGLIGEDPNGVPNNLMPYITQVALGKLNHLNIFGDDYDTLDGTGVRDYIHVVDLARGHVNALKAISANCGLEIYNFGTGKGYSVLELVHAFENVTNIHIPYEIVGRRPGDIATCYADPSKARKQLGWVAKYNIEDMCRDAWRWQQMNPNGFEN